MLIIGVHNRIFPIVTRQTTTHYRHWRTDGLSESAVEIASHQRWSERWSAAAWRGDRGGARVWRSIKRSGFVRCGVEPSLAVRYTSYTMVVYAFYFLSRFLRNCCSRQYTIFLHKRPQRSEWIYAWLLVLPIIQLSHYKVSRYLYLYLNFRYSIKSI